MENHYKTLGLKRGASLKEISAAYRSLALVHHPDKRKHSNSTESDEIFFKIKAAYQALQDPKTRAELDLQLVGLEERAKREAQMSEQREKMRNDLLSREREAAASGTGATADKDSASVNAYTGSTRNITLTNENACLMLKCKSTVNNPDIASEMIQTSLLPLNLLKLHTTDKNSMVAEFTDPQSAYKALISIESNDLISKAEWYKGYPPEDLNIVIGKSASASVNNTTTSSNNIRKVEKMKYSKDLEMSVLERLRQKKRKQKLDDQDGDE